jgi:hypothetical protein
MTQCPCQEDQTCKATGLDPPLKAYQDVLLGLEMIGVSKYQPERDTVPKIPPRSETASASSAS